MCTIYIKIPRMCFNTKTGGGVKKKDKKTHLHMHNYFFISLSIDIYFPIIAILLKSGVNNLRILQTKQLLMTFSHERIDIQPEAGTGHLRSVMRTCSHTLRGCKYINEPK